MAQRLGRQLPKASDLIVSELRHRILEERLPVGTRLPTEIELAEEFDMGRVTVREALRLLEREGLVRMKRGPSGGIFVRHPDVEQMSQAVAILLKIKGTELGAFTEYRLAIEPKIAELAALHATEEDKQRLVEVSRMGGGVESTADFHTELSTICGNDFFNLAQESMHVALRQHFREDQISEGHREGTALAHIKIAERIAAGDAEGANRAMRKHLEAYQEYITAVGLANDPVLP